MEMPLGHQEPLNGGEEQRTADEAVRLIRKLRWIGMDNEAEALQIQLALGRARPSDSVLAVPHDTD